MGKGVKTISAAVRLTEKIVKSELNVNLMKYRSQVRLTLSLPEVAKAIVNQDFILQKS